MRFAQVTAAEWRAQVEKELAGAPFEKALVHRTAEGIAVQPLYTERPAGEVRVDARTAAFRICVAVRDAAEVDEEIAGGAEALWIRGTREALGRIDFARTFVVTDAPLEAVAARAGKDAAFALENDPFGAQARGNAGTLEAMVEAARAVEARFPRAHGVIVSTLPYHDAGADAADEVAIALATGAAYVRALSEAGLAARQIALQVAVGRDTFGELSKLRALRITWNKMLAAFGAKPARALVHAVASSRTLAQRDPWVNMLRVTTEAFAAILGGADLVTPATFDDALGARSSLGRRVARNTGLVLREESSLGKVDDPAGGSYYFDTLTDALAREAWKRFQAIEREGGIAEALASGRIRARLEAAWKERLEAIAKRKAPVLGVSEFANLGEVLPERRSSGLRPQDDRQPVDAKLPVHRDAEAFEALRDRADALKKPAEAILVALGPLAENRARVGFAANFFGAGGIRARETSKDEAAAIACLCGSDERYAAEAVERAKALKAAGCKRVLVAGRAPRDAALEASLREAGVDGFLYVGCDAVSLLTELLDGLQ